MKKAILLLTMVFLLSSCTSMEITNTTSSPATDTTTDGEVNNTTASPILSSISYDDYLQIDLPQFGKEHQRLYYVARGKLTTTTDEDMVYLLTTVQLKDDLQTEVYIVVEVEDQLMCYTLGVYDKQNLNTGMLTLQDLDGDGIDEIFVNLEVSGNGATITQIYEIENQNIKMLADLSDFDTGYISNFQSNYKIKIQNKYTEYNVEYEIKDLFKSDFFDENGMALSKESIELSGFKSCAVIDINNDGVYELQCDQEVSLLGYIGMTRTVLQYNTKGTFEVVESCFIPYEP